MSFPSFFPGTEFQLSVSIAVAIAACFGFKYYIIAGIVASSLCLILGTHTILNVIVSMTFRIVAGGIIALLGSRFLIVILSGPIGTFAARVVLWLILGKGFIPMLIASISGMIFTAITAWPLCKLITKIYDDSLLEV